MAKNLEQLKTFATNSPLLKNCKKRLRIIRIQLRTSGTDYDSATNLKIYQFVATRGTLDLCARGALKMFTIKLFDTNLAKVKLILMIICVYSTA